MPHEADAILGMTVSSRLVKDSVIWAWTTNGKFSVKSAYRVTQKWLKSQNHKAEKYLRQHAYACVMEAGVESKLPKQTETVHVALV